MTKKGKDLHCDTEGCNATTELEGQPAETTWYFNYLDGRFVDYCPKHHPAIKRTPPK